MKRLTRHLLVLGLAVLPTQSWAQDNSPEAHLAQALSQYYRSQVPYAPPQDANAQSHDQYAQALTQYFRSQGQVPQVQDPAARARVLYMDALAKYAQALADYARCESQLHPSMAQYGSPQAPIGSPGTYAQVQYSPQMQVPFQAQSAPGGQVAAPMQVAPPLPTYPQTPLPPQLPDLPPPPPSQPIQTAGQVLPMPSSQQGELLPAPGTMPGSPQLSERKYVTGQVQVHSGEPVANDACFPQVVDCKNCKKFRFSVFGEILYWTVHGVDVPFAQAFDGVDPFNSVPRGPVGVVNSDFRIGYRGGAGVAINENSWLVGTLTYFHETANGSVAAPDTFVLHNLLAFPNTQNSATDSLKASASTTTELRTADLDYKCAFINNDHLLLSWLAGARYGHLGQKLEADYLITGTTTVTSAITFNGGGPRVGLDGEYKVLGGFYGYGKGVLSLLAGRFQGSYNETNVFTGLVGTTALSENRLVPILELELGAGWQSRNGRVRISGGYYVGNWFNAMTIPSLANSIQRNDFTSNGNNLHDSVIFDGFVGRVEIRF